MPLTDDELQHLLLAIERSPRADTVRAVGRGLLRRRRFAEAADVLTTSLRTVDDPGIWSLLAHACLGATRLQQALTALRNVDCDPATQLENARLLVLVFERLQRVDEARQLAQQLLEHHPDDPTVREAVSRLSATPPESTQHAEDPFYTVERAELYVSIGRVDRAIRIYRRIQLRYPDDASLAARVEVLLGHAATGDIDLADTLPPPAGSHESFSEGAATDILPVTGLGRLRPHDDQIVDDSEDAPTVQVHNADELEADGLRRPGASDA